MNTDDPKPLDHEEVVPEEFEDEDLYDGKDDDGVSRFNEDEDDPSLPKAKGQEQPAEWANDEAETRN